MRSGPYTGGAVLLPWSAIPLDVRRKLQHARPIAAENRRAETWRMLAIAVACGVALVVISGTGFGQIFHGLLHEKGWLFAAPYGFLVVGIVLPCAWLVRRLFSRASWLPFDRALLGLDAIEATPKGLIVRPFGDARFVSMVDSQIEITYADTSTFRIRALDATTIEQDMLDAEATLERASLTTDDIYRDVDPFHAIRERSLRAHRGALPLETRAIVSRVRANVAAAIGLTISSFVLGLFLLAARNQLSDDAAFTYARSRNEMKLYEGYLRGGSRHADEVEKLLPRVALDDAERGDADDIAHYLEKYPHSKYDTEARDQLSTQCRSLANWYLFHRDMKSAVQKLDAFVRNHPACESERPGVEAKFFEERRRNIREVNGMQPELRTVLLAFIDDIQKGNVPEILIVRDVVSGMWSDVFASQLDQLTGGARTMIDRTPGVAAAASIVIHDEPIVCPPGARLRDGAFTAHFTLFVDKVVKADWKSAVRSDWGLGPATIGEGYSGAVCDTLSRLLH